MLHGGGDPQRMERLWMANAEERRQKSFQVRQGARLSVAFGASFVSGSEDRIWWALMVETPT